MKRLILTVSAALLLFSACAILPAASPVAQPVVFITATPLPSTPTPIALPGLQSRFGGQQLILDKLVVQGNEVSVPSSVAYINFTADGKVNGKGGCNQFSGSYENPSGGQVKFGPLASTKMYCQETMSVETGFFQALQKVTRYRIDNIRLILESEDGQYLVRLYVPVR